MIVVIKDFSLTILQPDMPIRVFISFFISFQLGSGFSISYFSVTAVHFSSLSSKVEVIAISDSHVTLTHIC